MGLFTRLYVCSSFCLSLARVNFQYPSCICTCTCTYTTVQIRCTLPTCVWDAWRFHAWTMCIKGKFSGTQIPLYFSSGTYVFTCLIKWSIFPEQKSCMHEALFHTLTMSMLGDVIYGPPDYRDTTTNTPWQDIQPSGSGVDTNFSTMHTIHIGVLCMPWVNMHTLWLG